MQAGTPSRRSGIDIRRVRASHRFLNRRVIYYDQRSNGRSDLIKERERLAMDKHVADLEAVRRHFKLDKLALLGNSWGGMLISFYAAAHPARVERMVLHNPGEPTKALPVEAVDEIGARASTRATTKSSGSVSPSRRRSEPEVGSR